MTDTQKRMKAVNANIAKGPTYAEALDKALDDAGGIEGEILHQVGLACGKCRNDHRMRAIYVRELQGVQGVTLLVCDACKSLVASLVVARLGDIEKKVVVTH